MPDDHPIVERCPGCQYAKDTGRTACLDCGKVIDRPIVEHINQSEKWLEEFNKRPLMERLEWMLEPETMNISGRVEQIAKDAISEINRLTEAIREKDRRLERMADEADAWERTTRGI